VNPHKRANHGAGGELVFAPQPLKPASLCDAGFTARVVVLGCGFSCAPMWFFEDLY